MRRPRARPGGAPARSGALPPAAAAGTARGHPPPGGIPAPPRSERRAERFTTKGFKSSPSPLNVTVCGATLPARMSS